MSALTRAPQRLITILAISVAVLQLADFLWALRRYTVGLGRPSILSLMFGTAGIRLARL